MKYLKKFEALSYVDETNKWIDLKSKLVPLFEILGIPVTFSREVNTLTSYTTVTFNLNFGAVNHSILHIILSKIIDNKDFTCHSITKNNVILRVYSLILCKKKDKIDSNKKKITPGNDNDAYKEIIWLLLDLLESYVKLQIKCENGDNYSMDSDNNNFIRETITSYLKENLTSPNIVVPKETIEVLNDIISSNKKSFKLINSIKTKQPILYKQLTELNKNFDTASDMGEMGF